MTRPSMTTLSEEVAEVVRGLTGAHSYLATRLGHRWVTGTGFCHSSVGRDLEAIGLVESRLHHGRRQIRAMPALLAARASLTASAGGE